MTWDSVLPISWLNRQIDVDDQDTENSILHPTFLPVTEIETVARQIILEDYQDDPYLAELVVRIRAAVNTLDLFRDTGFTLSTPESIIESLENMCAMF